LSWTATEVDFQHEDNVFDGRDVADHEMVANPAVAIPVRGGFGWSAQKSRWAELKRVQLPIP